MTKTLTYLLLVIAGLLIIFGFVTATTYSQLAVAIVIYPTLIFLVFKLFPRTVLVQPNIAVQLPPTKLSHDKSETPNPNKEIAYISDIDKRAFIKLIGATGISFFLFSLLGRRVESLIFGTAGQSMINPPRVTDGNQSGLASASPTDGYKISEIMEEGLVTYYGFINYTGAWLIMREDSSNNNFRYAKGDSDLPGNWKNRENLRYDYYYNLF
ncbi:MAG: hypothetical protein NUV69_00945 [Candidatus Curtissbacteria bacterium]|nr:hypothetical protein [Candidatus Zambryskibacteria bacterium]MCR4324238.1 hypothetical protein [Candidatus Curtissbacteria bacterium]